MSAVPGLGRDTPDSEPGGGASSRSYSRQNSASGPARRGSQCCMSHRGSICEYSEGRVCEATPVGELCETRVAMMKHDTETVTNGHGEETEVSCA